MALKKPKTHTSARKKAQTPARNASALSTTSSRSKKAASKALTSTVKNTPRKKKISEREWRKLRELTLKMFEMVYESNQRGEFHRIM